MSDSERADAREWLYAEIRELIYHDSPATPADAILNLLVSPEARPYLYQLLGPDPGEETR